MTFMVYDCGRCAAQCPGDMEAEFWVFSDLTVSYFEVTQLTFRLAGVCLAGVRVLAAGLALAFPLPIAARIA
jgi:hypothetical protein